MNIARKDLPVLGIVALIGVGAMVSIAADSWRLAAVCLVILQVISVVLVLTAQRRTLGPGTGGIKGLEDAVANVSMRIVTESQATQRAIDGLRESSDAYRSGSPRSAEQ